jgi:hypothetical protein
LTQDKAAAELGWKPRTLKARVARPRHAADPLDAPRVELPVALAAPMLSVGLTAVVPALVTAGLAASAVDVALCQAPDAGVSLAAVGLTRIWVSPMATARLTFFWPQPPRW